MLTPNLAMRWPPAKGPDALYMNLRFLSPSRSVGTAQSQPHGGNRHGRRSAPPPPGSPRRRPRLTQDSHVVVDAEEGPFLSPAVHLHVRGRLPHARAEERVCGEKSGVRRGVPVRGRPPLHSAYSLVLTARAAVGPRPHRSALAARSMAAVAPQRLAPAPARGEWKCARSLLWSGSGG